MYGLGYLMAMQPLLWRLSQISYPQLLERLFGKATLKKMQAWELHGLQMEWRGVGK